MSLINLPEDIQWYIYKTYFNNYVIPEYLEHIRTRMKKQREPVEFHSTGSDNKLLANMYNVISELNLWTSIKNTQVGEGGYMFSRLEWISQVMNHPKVIQDGHSGSSGTWCLRVMDYIAKNGWIQYCDSFNRF